MPLAQCDGEPAGWGQRGSGSILGLGQREIEGYSISRLIAAASSGNWQNAGLELECSRALQSKGFDAEVLIPSEALRVFNSQSSPTQAGNLVQTEHLSSAFIDYLRARTFIFEMGAVKLNGLQGNVQIPRQTGTSTLGWISEDADLPATGPAFDKLELKPRTVGAYAEFSRMIAVQSDPAIEQLILKDFGASLARELDRAAVIGDGILQPRGILNQSGVSSIALGTNGGAPTWSSIVQMESKLADLNADQGTVGYVVSTKLKAILKQTLKAASASSEFIWADSPQMNGQGSLNGYKAMASTSMPSSLTKGTGSNLSAAIFEDWSSLVIGEWGALSLEINPVQNFRSGRISARILMFTDMVIRHAESFCVVTDAITN